MVVVYQRTRKWELASTIIVLVYISAVFAYQLRRPQNDWDMLPYMVIALTDCGETFESAHRHVYQAVRANVPPAVFDELSDKFPVDNQDRVYRAAALQPAKFAESLPFYTVKPAFPALIAGLYKVGVDLIWAPRILAALGYALSCLTIYVWILPWMAPAVAAALTIILALIPQLTRVSTLTTPDSLSLFFVLVGVYLSIGRKRVTAGLTVLLLSVTIRPENILYFLVFAAYFFIENKDRRNVSILALIAMCLYIFLVRSSENYGWKTLFYFTLVDETISLPGFISPLKLEDYFRIYRQQIATEIMDPLHGLAIFVLAGFGAAAMKVRAGNFRDPYLHLVFLASTLAIGRILILPASFYRALLPCYMMATVALIHACVFAMASFPDLRAKEVV